MRRDKLILKKLILMKKRMKNPLTKLNQKAMLSMKIKKIQKTVMKQMMKTMLSI